MWPELEYRLDILRVTKGALMNIYNDVICTINFINMFIIYRNYRMANYDGFLMINACNQ